MQYLSCKDLAITYEKKGDKEQAIRWYKKSLEELGENVWEMWNWYGVIEDCAAVCLRLGGNKEAASIYNKLITKNPNNKKVGEWRSKLRQTGY